MAANRINLREACMSRLLAAASALLFWPLRHLACREMRRPEPVRPRWTPPAGPRSPPRPMPCPSRAATSGARHGAIEVITIIGTYHFDDPRHAPNLAALTPAITAATTVLVEAGPEEEKALIALIARDPSKMMITDGPTLAQQLPPEVWDPLKEAHVRPRASRPSWPPSSSPGMSLTLLSIPPCAMAEMSRSPKGLDGVVIDTAAGRRGAGAGAGAVRHRLHHLRRHDRG